MIPSDQQTRATLHQNCLIDPVLRAEVLDACLKQWAQFPATHRAWLLESQRPRPLPDKFLATLEGDANLAYLYKLLFRLRNSRDYLQFGVEMTRQISLQDAHDALSDRMVFESMLGRHVEILIRHGRKLVGQYGEFLDVPEAWSDFLNTVDDAVWQDPFWDTPEQYRVNGARWVRALDLLLARDNDLPARLSLPPRHPELAVPSHELLSRYARIKATVKDILATLSAQGVPLRVFGSLLRGPTGERRFHAASDVDFLLPGEDRAIYDKVSDAFYDMRVEGIDFNYDLVWEGACAPGLFPVYLAESVDLAGFS